MRIVQMALSALAIVTLSTTLASAQAAPGTTITNTIDLSYSSGGTTISAPAAASVSFTVDRQIDLIVEGLNAGAVVFAEQGANDPVLSFSVQNLGNDDQGFDISIATSGTLALTYATTAGAEGTYWTVISDDATPGAGTEVLYDVSGTLNAGDLPAGGTYYLHVYANIANTATSGQSLSVDVTATALDAGTSTVTVELRDQGLDAIDTIFTDPGLDGFEEATEALTINAPELTASKTVTVISENLDGTFNCATGTQVAGAEAPIPGACLEYTISVTNGSGATLAARNLQIVDEMPIDVTYEAHAVGSFTTVTNAGRIVTGDLTNLAPGATATFTIRATVG